MVVVWVECGGGVFVYGVLLGYEFVFVGLCVVGLVYVEVF